MSTKRETRRAEIRAATLPDGRPGVTLKIITPGVVDDYGSVFMPDAFDDSLGTRAPVMCWSHDWAEPLGPYVSHTRGADGSPEVSFAFSDFDAVPMARRAHAQVADGTIGDCSVGFSGTERRSPSDEEARQYPGAREIITRAELDEVSLVLRGAVPGAKVLSVRAAGQVVALDDAVELARRVNAGELTQDDARTALELLAQDGGGATEASTEGAASPSVEAEADAAQADIDAALAEADAFLAERSR